MVVKINSSIEDISIDECFIEIYNDEIIKCKLIKSIVL